MMMLDFSNSKEKWVAPRRFLLIGSLPFQRRKWKATAFCNFVRLRAMFLGDLHRLGIERGKDEEEGEEEEEEDEEGKRWFLA